MFDRVYLINLKRRPDRLAAFEALCAEKEWKLAAPIIFEAIDGNRVGVPDYYISGGGAWGCLRSHVRILEQCLMDDVKSVLILEDDVTWKRDAWERLDEFLRIVPSDWDQLMLGGQQQRKPESISPGVVRCLNCQRTHAYAIRGRAMKDLLRLWFKCNRHIDHDMGPWQAKWRVYAPAEFIFGQGESRSDISGNRDHTRFWTPPSASAPVVHLTCSREIARQLRGHGLHMGYMRDPVTDYDAGLVNLVATNNLERGLKKWLDTILWEAASEEGAVACVWHPIVTLDMLKKIYAGPLIDVKGATLEECLTQIPKQAAARRLLAQTHLILLRATRGVMEALRGHGWHSGYWRDAVSGQDNGLREIADLKGQDRADRLRAWVEELSREAENLANGVVCCWHSEITQEELQAAASSRKVIAIDAHTVGDALQAFQAATQEKAPCGRCGLLVPSSELQDGYKACLMCSGRVPLGDSI